MNNLQAEKNYLTEQFQALGYTVTGIEFGDDETITVDTTAATFRMWIGSDDDCYQFVSGDGTTLEIPFLGDRAMGL